jgi:hypothetical protein
MKNRYGTEDKNIPIFLLDDYLSHYGNKFKHKSSILDNFTSTSIADILPNPVTTKYPQYRQLSDILDDFLI